MCVCNSKESCDQSKLVQPHLFSQELLNSFPNDLKHKHFLSSSLDPTQKEEKKNSQFEK